MSLAAAQAALSQGNQFRAGGQLGEAALAYRRAADIAPGFAPAHYNLGITLRQARDWKGAALAFRAAARLDPSDFDALQNVVTTLAQAIEADAPVLFPAHAPAAAPSDAGVSIVVCSVEPARLERMQRNYRDALRGRPHEFVVIDDARSLAEGYNRALAACHHDIVVFSHDDVELLSAAPFDALERALREHDIVGVAGSTRVTGPAVMWAGHPHLHGGVAYPAGDGGWDATVYSLASGILGGMQALDGLLIAARREAARAVAFDAATFDGFHFYDLDFTYRAHLAGRRVAVTTEVAAIHASAGGFDDEWRRGAQRFAAKFPRLAAPAGAHHSYGARLGSRERLLRFHAELRALGAAA